MVSKHCQSFPLLLLSPFTHDLHMFIYKQFLKDLYVLGIFKRPRLPNIWTESSCIIDGQRWNLVWNAPRPDISKQCSNVLATTEDLDPNSSYPFICGSAALLKKNFWYLKKTKEVQVKKLWKCWGMKMLLKFMKCTRHLVKKQNTRTTKGKMQRKLERRL